MKTFRYLLLAMSLTLCHQTFAAETSAIEQNIIKVATQYIHSIACETSPVTAKQIIPLTPYSSEDTRWDAQYAVLWSGDIGCQGGSGTSSANLLIVKIGAGAFYYVDSKQSSPNIHYESPTNWVTNVTSFSANRMVLAGRTYASQDPHCCPSVLTEFILERDKQANWRLIDKHTLSQ